MFFESQNIEVSLPSSLKTSCQILCVFSRIVSLRFYVKSEKFQAKRKAVFCLLPLQNLIRYGSDKYMNRPQKFQCAVSEEVVSRLRNNDRTSWLGVMV